MLNPKVQRGRGEEEINAFRFCAFFFFVCACVSVAVCSCVSTSMARQRHLWHVYIWVCAAFFLLNYVTRLSNRILSLYLHLLFSFFLLPRCLLFWHSEQKQTYTFSLRRAPSPSFISRMVLSTEAEGLLRLLELSSSISHTYLTLRHSGHRWSLALLNLQRCWRTRPLPPLTHLSLRLHICLRCRLYCRRRRRPTPIWICQAHPPSFPPHFLPRLSPPLSRRSLRHHRVDRTRQPTWACSVYWHCSSLLWLLASSFGVCIAATAIADASATSDWMARGARVTWTTPTWARR